MKIIINNLPYLNPSPFKSDKTTNCILVHKRHLKTSLVHIKSIGDFAMTSNLYCFNHLFQFCMLDLIEGLSN